MKKLYIFFIIIICLVSSTFIGCTINGNSVHSGKHTSKHTDNPITVFFKVTIPASTPTGDIYVGISSNPAFLKLSKLNEATYIGLASMNYGTIYYYSRGTTASRDTSPGHFISYQIAQDAVWGWVDRDDSVSRLDFQKGMTFGGQLWRQSELSLVDYNLDQMKNYGVEWVCIVPQGYFVRSSGDYYSSGNYRAEVDTWYASGDPKGIYPNQTVWVTPTLTDAQIINIISKAHQRGMKVMLKPHVDAIDSGLSNAIPRGCFKPGDGTVEADWNQWYDSFQTFLIHYAGLAYSNNVELFCIGAEMDSVANEANSFGPAAHDQTAHFRTIITAVKSAYHWDGVQRKITYSVSGYDPTNPSNVKFWDALDYIGYEPYFQISTQSNADLATLKTDFANILDNTANGAKAISTLYGKQVIFTEAAYKSFDGCTSGDPLLCPDPCVVDHQEQADAMETLLSTASERSWIAGVYWWAWYLIPQGNAIEWQLNDPNDPFTGKIGGQVISKWYHMIK